MQRRFPPSAVVRALHDLVISKGGEAAEGRRFTLAEARPGGRCFSFHFLGHPQGGGVFACVDGGGGGGAQAWPDDCSLRTASSSAVVLIDTQPFLALCCTACCTCAQAFSASVFRWCGVWVGGRGCFKHAAAHLPLFFFQSEYPCAAGAPSLADLDQTLQDANVHNAMLGIRWTD